MSINLQEIPIIITIARGFGSGGKDIAMRLAKTLDIPCYEKSILKMASEVSGLNESLFEDVDEKLRGSVIAKKLKGFFEPSPRPSPSTRAFVSDDSLFRIQSGIIQELAKTTSCVIVGKCANKVLADFDNVVNVYIEAPRPYCLWSITNKMQVNEDEAARLITKTDKYRADYYKYYSGGDYWTNPTSYDMTLNTARVGRQNCVNIIKDYIEMKFGGED